MPSFGIHYATLDELRLRLKGSPRPNDVEYLRFIDSAPEMASLGAIGPDLFYYLGSTSLADTIAPLATVFTFINGVASKIGEMGALASDAGLQNIGSLVSQVGRSAELLLRTTEAEFVHALVKISDVVTGSYILQESPIQAESVTSKWNWGDILHDRAGGMFSEAILRKAQASGRSDWMAFYVGYVTHIATDFVGHPYVNQVVGGPARSHLMRHTIAEKYMDAAVYRRKTIDITQSKLYSRTFNIPQLDDLCGLLASETAQLAVSNQWFQTRPSPSAEEIRSAIGYMNELFRLVTDEPTVPQPHPPHIQFPPLPTPIAALFGGGSGARGRPRKPRSLSDWLKMALDLFLSGPKLLLALADLAVGIVSYPAELILYQMQAVLYRIYRSSRFFLVAAGLAFPLPDEIDSSLGAQFIRCRRADGDRYPLVPSEAHGGIERYQASTRMVDLTSSDLDYLHYPDQAKSERPLTRSSPYPEGVSPEYFINGIAQDPAYLRAWKATRSPLEVGRLRPIVSSPVQGRLPICGFGSAVDCTISMLDDPAAFRHVNLDSDRGYGYRQWIYDSGLRQGNIVNEGFLFP